MAAPNQTCPIARTAVIIGSRWTAQIIGALLAHEPRRFQELQEAIPGIVPATLSSRLKMLEESGIVRRQIYETHPPRAEYFLTERGRRMSGIIRAMQEWGYNWGQSRGRDGEGT